MATSSIASSHSHENADVLNSWKEIATYLGRGVRTVQRYERNLGLPVRRLGGESGRSVIAFPQDLDDWLTSAPLGEHRNTPERRMLETVDIARTARKESERLRFKCHELREAHHEMLNQLCVNLLGIVKTIKLNPTHLQAVHQNQIDMLAHAFSDCGAPFNATPVQDSPSVSKRRA